MALRRTLAKRLFNASTNLEYSSPITTLVKSPTSIANFDCLHKFIASPDSTSAAFFCQRRAINNYSFLTLPNGKILREKLMSFNINAHLDHIAPPEIGAPEAKRVLRVLQMEQIKQRLRNIPHTTIPYAEFLRICGDACSGNTDMALEFAKLLDQSGTVIILKGIVFLRPDQVAKSMERVISESIAMPNDPRRKELEHLEKQKARIDEKARSLVRGELYCGLGFMVVQTLGFMRLTFWELSWDVMEPICFFVTSLHFAAAYLFFLRTSKEPSFEGYFQRRFTVKQNKLMKAHNFDIKRYNQLCQAFYPNFERGILGHAVHG